MLLGFSQWCQSALKTPATYSVFLFRMMINDAGSFKTFAVVAVGFSVKFIAMPAARQQLHLALNQN